MITDLDKTIRQLLTAELPIKNGEIDIKFDQPTREWSTRLNRPTINFYLYDVRENNTLRQHQWQRLDNGNGAHALQKRTPFRIDCNYMLTCWASESDDEHRLLTRVMLALFAHPTLAEHMLVDSLKNQPFPIQARLARHDKLTNPAEVWSALDNEMRPSVSYSLTIALDPWSEISGPIVKSYTMRRGITHTLPHAQHIDEFDAEMVSIGGTVFKNGEPQPGIEVAIKGTGFMKTTDAYGRYMLGSLPPGDYTLMVWPREGDLLQQPISIPEGDYNIELE